MAVLRRWCLIALAVQGALFVLGTCFLLGWSRRATDPGGRGISRSEYVGAFFLLIPSAIGVGLVALLVAGACWAVLLHWRGGAELGAVGAWAMKGSVVCVPLVCALLCAAALLRPFDRADFFPREVPRPTPRPLDLRQPWLVSPRTRRIGRRCRRRVAACRPIAVSADAVVGSPQRGRR